ncbi:hypothetical protein I548_4158 [Mycobacterium intracellulare]|nr:hypothetical protein I548_4158 [Mycobacterium intracellulare]
MRAAAVVLLAALLVLTGCSRSIGGNAVKAGGNVPRNNNSQQQYPNLLKECEVLTSDILAKTVGPTRSTFRARSSARSAGGRRPTRPA